MTRRRTILKAKKSKAKKKARPGKKTGRATRTKTKAKSVPRQPELPRLDVTLPMASPGNGFLIAETYLARNESGILDIIAPASANVEAWCCYGRGVKSREWVVMSNHPDLNGRFIIPIPRTHFYAWGFGQAVHDAQDGESIWRVHAHNVAFDGKGREVWLRFVLQMSPLDERVTARALPPRLRSTAKRVSPKRAPAAKSFLPGRKEEPLVTVPVPV